MRPALLLLCGLLGTLWSAGFMWHQLLVQRQLAQQLRSLSAELLSADDQCALPLDEERPAEVQRLEQRLAERERELRRLEQGLHQRQRSETQGAAQAARLRGESEAGQPLAVVAVSSHPGRWQLRNALRASWFPGGEELRQLESSGLVVRFFVGALPPDDPSSALRREAVAAEAALHGDLVLLEHEERAGDLSTKTLRVLSSALQLFSPRVVVKADDDILLSLPALHALLRAHANSADLGRLYLGCLRSGSPLSYAGGALPELGQSLVFSDPEPSVLPYAAGQLYALGGELASHLVASEQLLRRMGNEDVSMGAWLVGLQHSAVDEPRLCCERACRLDGGACVAVVQPQCAGVCDPERAMPRLSELCDEQAGEEGWAQAEEVLAENAARARARMRGDGAGGEGGTDRGRGSEGGKTPMTS
jgi:hypothetical protein